MNPRPSGANARGNVSCPTLQASGHVAQPLPAAREEPAQKTASAQLVQTRLPMIGAAAQAVEDRGHLAPYRCLPLAERAPTIIDEQQVLAERETLRHPFPRRIQPPPVHDRTETEVLFQTRRRGGSRHAAVASTSGHCTDHGLKGQAFPFCVSFAVRNTLEKGFFLQCGRQYPVLRVIFDSFTG